MDQVHKNGFTLLHGEDESVTTTKLLKKAKQKQLKQQRLQQQQSNDHIVVHDAQIWQANDYKSWDSWDSSSTSSEEESEYDSASESESEDDNYKEMTRTSNKVEVMAKEKKKSKEESDDDHKKKIFVGKEKKVEEEGGLKKWMRSQRRYLVKHKLWYATLFMWKLFIASVVITLLMLVLPDKNELKT